MVYRIVAIVVANGSAGLAVRLVERRCPELKGALAGLYIAIMLFGFTLFLRDLPVAFVSPLFLIATLSLGWSVRKRYVASAMHGAAHASRS